LPTVQFTCPRCLYTEPFRPEMEFCPRCGLANAKNAWLDNAPADVMAGKRVFRVTDRIAVGSISIIYRCRFDSGSKQAEGVFKIARDARTNGLISNEAAVLGRLQSLDTAGRYTPFLPKVEETLAMSDASTGASRAANVLRMDDEILSPDELSTLGEVRAQYPGGLDPRHVAWIWRRILTVLGFVHTHDVVHGAVLPMHVLIEPKGHKLVLIDWCCAVADASQSRQPVTIITGGYTPWYKREGALRSPPTPALDIALGARCMIELLGGDPVEATFPPAVELGLQRYFTRCLGGDSTMRPDAWKLLADFDRLIEAMCRSMRHKPSAIRSSRNSRRR
jgi:hypothetical protein